MKCGSSELSIDNFRLLISVGCEPLEKNRLQYVDITLKLIPQGAPPEACQTDNLADTICYAELCKVMRETATQKHFEMIEHLAQKLMESLKLYVAKTRSKGSTQGAPPLDFELAVKKLNPPIEGLLGGVTFTLRDQM